MGGRWDRGSAAAAAASAAATGSGLATRPPAAVWPAPVAQLAAPSRKGQREGVRGALPMGFLL